MSARDDIVAFLKANWSSTPLYPMDDYVSLDDIPAKDEAAFIIVDFPPANSQIASIAVTNSNGWRDQGQIQFALFHPIGKEPAVSRLLTEDFRRLLRGRRIGATVVGAIEPFSSLGQQDGKWQVYISLADFYRDEFQ
jgi:hypothetical protein